MNICINSPSASYVVSSQMIYGATDFTDETYYFTNTSLDNVSDSLNLYLTPGATTVLFSVVDEFDTGIPNVYIFVQAYDLTTNSYLVSEILKTDSSGNANGHIILTSQWYKFILVRDGNTVQESLPTQITTTTKTFRLYSTQNSVTSYKTYFGVSGTVTFNNATKNFNYIYTDPTGGVVTGCIDIVKQTALTTTSVGQSCVDASSANIIYNIGNVSDQSTYIATGKVSINGDSFVLATKSVSFDDRWRSFGATGLLIAFFLSLTAFVLWYWSPIIGLVMMLFAAIMTVVAGLAIFTWTSIVVLVILVGLTIWRLSRQ
jgi:hypothetical protein